MGLKVVNRVDLAARLKELMKERGYSVNRLSRESGVAWTTIKNYFNSDCQPTIGTLDLLCKGLGITLVQFFDVEGNSGLTTEQRDLLNRWSMITAEQREMLDTLLNIIIKSNQVKG